MNKVWEVRGQVVTSPEQKARTQKERDAIRLELFEMWQKTGVSFYRALQAHEMMQTGRKRKLGLCDEAFDAYLAEDSECLPPEAK